MATVLQTKHQQGRGARGGLVRLSKKGCMGEAGVAEGSGNSLRGSGACAPRRRSVACRCKALTWHAHEQSSTTTHADKGIQ